MSILVQLLVAIAGSVPALLNSEGIISNPLTNLFNVSIAAIASLVAAIKGGGTVTSELQASLTALQAEYTAIQKDTSASPAVIGGIAEVSNLVSDAITGYENAQTVDPSTLPVPPAAS
jgi:hypothetical protein